MSIIRNLFGSVFGDSAEEIEARGDRCAGVRSWRRAYEEYEHALQKTPRGASFRRVSAKLEESRLQAFESLIEDIHSQIDIREFTYAKELIEFTRELAETSSHLARVEECEDRLQGAGRYMPRKGPAVPMRENNIIGASPPEAQPRGNPTEMQPQHRLPAGARAESAQAGSSAPPLAGSSEDIAVLLKHLPEAELRARLQLGPRYQAAVWSIADGDFHSAVPILQELYENNPDLDWLFYDWTSVLRSWGRHQEAQDLYYARLEARPTEWQAPYELSQSLWDSGAGDQALQVLEAAIQKHPKSGHLMAQWGIFLRKIGGVEHGLEKLQLALQLDEFDDAGLYHTIAGFFCEGGDLERAERAYLKALELKPNSVGSLLDYTEFLIDLKKDGHAALATLDRAFKAVRLQESRKKMFEVYASFLSSRAHLLLGEREMALLAATRALEGNETSWLYQRLEDQRQAVLAV